MRRNIQLGFGLVAARGKACGSKGQNTSQQGTNQYRGEMGGQQAEQFHGGHFAPGGAGCMGQRARCSPPKQGVNKAKFR